MKIWYQKLVHDNNTYHSHQDTIYLHKDIRCSILVWCLAIINILSYIYLSRRGDDFLPTKILDACSTTTDEHFEHYFRWEVCPSKPVIQNIVHHLNSHLNNIRLATCCINLNLTFALIVGSLSNSASKGQSFLRTSLVTECSCMYNTQIITSHI